MVYCKIDCVISFHNILQSIHSYRCTLQENKFCQNTNNQRDFFGGRACKSPYATYTVVVPKGSHECSLNADDWVSGSNCKGLDLTK